MTLFIFISFCLLLLIARLFFKYWTQVKFDPSVDSPEWLALVQKRDDIERDLSLSEETKQVLRGEWVVTAESILSKHEQFEDGKQLERRLSKQTIGLITASVLILGVVFYSSVGRWDMQALSLPQLNATINPMQTSAEPPPVAGTKHPGDMKSLEDRIAELREKLKENPNDLDRWVLLARSLGVQRDFSGSAEALQQALKLSPGHPDLLADLADTVAMLNNKSLLGEPSELIAQALKADPKHPKALALAATAAMQKGDKKAALAIWHTLRGVYPEGSVDVARIDEIIKEINIRGLNRPDQSNSSLAATNSAEQTSTISGNVRLDASLIKILKNRDLTKAVLYVFAKMESGPPMPLAVMRASPETLLRGESLAFNLDDSLAMSPAMKLSNAEQVKLEARIAMTGNPIKQSGDVGVAMTGVRVGTHGLMLVIKDLEP